MTELAEIAAFLDDVLQIATVPDYPGALNGVQLANRGEIDRIATAVDFSTAAINGAIDSGARLLLVHHGMFWGSPQPIVGHRYGRIRALIEHDIAVYSAHLPLDVHPELGNNALLAAKLGLEPSGGFASFQGRSIGLSGRADVPTRMLVDRVTELSKEFGGTLVATPFDPRQITRAWGLCTGAGADSSTLGEAAERRLDTIIVGEGPHHTAVEARDRGIVVLYAGHYATETLGVRALGEAVAARFGVSSTFIDAPTGL
ncbi:MAG TPA: Nif3-like dinuclear metal center hexameric protein [Gemmatimonadaceae bacterium]|nr:Nif3-like dinuclear metal center hexameric protein [Gemmatimonadaceae bacterium]